MTDRHFYNLHDRRFGSLRQIAEGIEARIFSGEKAMLSIVRLAPGSSSPIHSHPEEQWGVLLEGSGTRVQGDREMRVAAGDFWLTPGNLPHGFRAGPDGALILDIFSPPREGYRA